MKFKPVNFMSKCVRNTVSVIIYTKIYISKFITYKSYLPLGLHTNASLFAAYKYMYPVRIVLQMWYADVENNEVYIFKDWM